MSHTMNKLKKLVCLTTAAALIFVLAGCGAVSEQEPGPVPGNTSPGGKEMLPLQYMPAAEVELEPDPPKYGDISLELMHPPETGEIRFNKDLAILDAFAGFIRERFGIELDERWKVFIHWYDGDETTGMAEFLYTIGEIDTNRSVIFQIEDDVAVRVYYKFLSSVTDEEDLLERVRLFKERYEQERLQLRDDEHMEEETFSYVYYYGTDKLVYCYNAFFSYSDLGVINNDWGTQCFIGKKGEAAFFGISGGMKS